MSTKALRSLVRPSLETAPPGMFGPGGGEVRPLSQGNHAKPGQVELAPVVPVDQELVARLEVVNHHSPVLGRQRTPLVSPLAPQVDREDGIPEPLQVLGQPLVLQLADRVLEVLGRTPFLVDHHDHRRSQREPCGVSGEVRHREQHAVRRPQLHAVVDHPRRGVLIQRIAPRVVERVAGDRKGAA